MWIPESFTHFVCFQFSFYLSKVVFCFEHGVEDGVLVLLAGPGCRYLGFSLAFGMVSGLGYGVQNRALVLLAVVGVGVWVFACCAKRSSCMLAVLSCRNVGVSLAFGICGRLQWFEHLGCDLVCIAFQLSYCYALIAIWLFTTTVLLEWCIFDGVAWCFIYTLISIELFLYILLAHLFRGKMGVYQPRFACI